MRTIALTLLLVAPAPAQVLLGIDSLARDGFVPLAGKRVGLITNHTGRDSAGTSTIDLLARAPGVKLQALFSPEHGIRGALDEKVGDSRDETTGLPVWSLYGETRKPRPEQLAELDVLVYDIQDIGARFYTYVATLRHCMEAAAERKIPLLVCDRPNPIDGVHVEGPVLDAGRESFTGPHTLPVRHGMTVGELAAMMNAERSIGCDLVVAKCEGWKRAMLFDATGLEWRNPSPNMRSLTEALLYPGIGLLETTNLSVGRGTDTPFEVLGAPWCDGKALARQLRALGLPGVTFVPVRFTPRASKHQGKECSGVNVIVTNREVFEPVRTGIAIACALVALHGKEWEVARFDGLLVNAKTLAAARAGRSAAGIVASWDEELRAFAQRREKYLIYR